MAQYQLYATRTINHNNKDYYAGQLVSFDTESNESLPVGSGYATVGERETTAVKSLLEAGALSQERPSGIVLPGQHAVNTGADVQHGNASDVVAAAGHPQIRDDAAEGESQPTEEEIAAAAAAENRQ
jgi:hypothetical protein